MYNPFQERPEQDTMEGDCIRKAVAGDKKALEAIIIRHQSWIYNIAVAMTGDRDAAEDVTQEVLIKVITKLSSYDARRASFRTWLYRIVVNHILNAKEDRKEKFFSSIEMHGGMDHTIAQYRDSRKSLQPGYALIHDEVKIACVSCILLCLARKERIVFILGTMFSTTDRVGAEICGMSRENFRKTLSRSRSKLYDFFTTNCSLLNENNPCTCAAWAEPLKKAGMLPAPDVSEKHEVLGSLRDMLGGVITELEDSYYEFSALFREQPFLKGPDMVQWLGELFRKNEFKGLFVEE